MGFTKTLSFVMRGWPDKAAFKPPPPLEQHLSPNTRCQLPNQFPIPFNNAHTSQGAPSSPATYKHTPTLQLPRWTLEAPNYSSS